jgi:type IV pilus assembly protein PilA
LLTVIQRLRSRLRREEGFTLIELLVVMLIIGILAAIAIPTFLNQKGKANDTQAKSMAKTAQTAIETWDTDNATYNCITAGPTDCLTNLHAIEATVPANNSNDPWPCVTNSGVYVGPASAACTPAAPGSLSYEITVKAPSTGDVFSIDRASDGTTQYLCWVPAGQNRAGCPATGKWG